MLSARHLNSSFHFGKRLGKYSSSYLTCRKCDAYRGVINHSRQMVNVSPFTTNWAANIQIHHQDNIFKSPSIFNSYVFKLLSNENQYFRPRRWERAWGALPGRGSCARSVSATRSYPRQIQAQCPVGRSGLWPRQRQLATAQRARVEQQFNSNLTALLGALLAALTHPGRRQRVRHRVVEMGSADLSSPLWGNFDKSRTCTLLAENRSWDWCSSCTGHC